MINHKQDPPNKGKAEQPTEKTTHTHRARKDQQDTDSRKGEGGISQQYVNMLFVRGILKISTGPRTLHIIFNTQDEALLSPPGQSWPISWLATSIPPIFGYLCLPRH